MQRSSARWQELPLELIRRCYAAKDAKGDDVLPLRQRVRGRAVSEAFYEALEGMPIDLYVSGFAALDEWALRQQPSVGQLLCSTHSQLAPALLQAIQCESLCRLVLRCTNGLPPPEALPSLARFANLSELDITDFKWDATYAAWFTNLAALQQLCSLAVQINSPPAQPVLMPRLPSLTSLRACSPAAVFEFELPLEVDIDLGVLPSLQQLSLEGWSSARVAAGASSNVQSSASIDSSLGSARDIHHGLATPASGCSSLTSLELEAHLAEVDFNCMPALVVARLAADELEGGGSIAGATALSRLEIDSCWFAGAILPWVAKVLRSAPPSLHGLLLRGHESQGAIGAALVGMSQLQALALESSWSQRLPHVPPADAALWRGLRGLHLCCKAEADSPLPDLSGATQLTRLQCTMGKLFHEDVERLKALPCLKHLGVIVDPDIDVIAKVILRNALPLLETLRVGQLESGHEYFVAALSDLA